MTNSFCILKRLLAPGLCYWLCCSLALAQTLPTRIDVVVVEGEGGTDNPGQRMAQVPTVRVEDENGKPVAGAAVVFTLPIAGTTGEFSNGSKSLTILTDANGMAAAQGLKTNQVPGKLQIYVTAAYRGLRSRNLITRINAGDARAAHKSNGKLWAILVVVGAAAAGGAVVATHKGSSSSNSAGPAAPSVPAAIVINPGTGSINPPH
jgi:hypothetical protein